MTKKEPTVAESIDFLRMLVSSHGGTAVFAAPKGERISLQAAYHQKNRVVSAVTVILIPKHQTPQYSQGLILIDFNAGTVAAWTYGRAAVPGAPMHRTYEIEKIEGAFANLERSTYLRGIVLRVAEKLRHAHLLPPPKKKGVRHEWLVRPMGQDANRIVAERAEGAPEREVSGVPADTGELPHGYIFSERAVVESIWNDCEKLGYTVHIFERPVGNREWSPAPEFPRAHDKNAVSA